MPIDFLSRNASFPIKETDAIGDRLKHAHDVFDKRENTQEAPQHINEENLKVRISKFRELVLTMGVNKIEDVAVGKFNLEFPKYVFAGHRKVNSISDFAEAYRLGPNNRTMRKMVNFFLHIMWGSNNRWAVDMEDEIMKELNMEYKQDRVGGKTRRRHRGGCIKSILVKKKSGLLEPIKTAGKKKHKEVIYLRGKTYDESGQLILPEGVLKMISADEEVHGFDGFLGICEGHVGAVAFADTPKTPKGEEYPIVDWVKEMLQSKLIHQEDDLILQKKEIYWLLARDEKVNPNLDPEDLDPKDHNLEDIFANEDEDDLPTQDDLPTHTVSSIVRLVYKMIQGVLIW